MDENIIRIVLNYLPDDLKTDEILNGLEERAEEYLNGHILGSIRVNESLYNEINCKYDTLDLQITYNDSNLVYMFVISDIGTLDYRIKKINEDYYIVMTIIDNVTKFKTTINYNKSSLLSKVEIIKTKNSNDMDVYYEYDVYYYDEIGKLIPRNKYLSREKLQNFMIEFGVNKYEAMLGITNFEKYYLYFNQKRSMAIMDFCDENFVEEKQIFCPPFSLDNFELFKIDNNSDKINAIKEPLKAQIGIDGELIMSSNIYQNIYSYLVNISCSISTNGYIIKKVNDIYTLYYVNIKENNILVIPKTLTIDEVKNIYFSNSKNEEIIGLKEFFGIPRSL